MVRLQGAELADQLVVLGVGDLGIVEPVVPVVVESISAPELLHPRPGVGIPARFAHAASIPEPITSSGRAGS